MLTSLLSYRSSLVEASKSLSRRRDLEAFLVECINDVKKERKLRGAPSVTVGELLWKCVYTSISSVIT